MTCIEQKASLCLMQDMHMFIHYLNIILLDLEQTNYLNLPKLHILTIIVIILYFLFV